jgi:hypothetical protein
MAQAGTQGEFGTQVGQDILKLTSAAGLAQPSIRTSGWARVRVTSTFNISGGAELTVDVGNIFIRAFNASLGLWALCKGLGAGVGVGVGVSKIKGVKMSPVSVGGTSFDFAARLAQFDISRFLPSGDSPLFLGPAGLDDSSNLFRGFATFFDASAAAGLLGGGIGYGVSLFALSDAPLMVTGGAVQMLKSAAMWRRVKAFGLVYGGAAPIIPAVGAGVDQTVYVITVQTQAGTSDGPPSWGV